MPRWSTLLAEQKSIDAGEFIAQLRERGYTLVSVER
jgi:sugar phosphate isomerase/epimerase